MSELNKPNAIFAEIKSFNKSLKHVTTVVRTNTVVTSKETSPDFKDIAGVLEGEEIEEYQDEKEKFEKDTTEVAKLISNSKKIVIYTVGEKFFYFFFCSTFEKQTNLGCWNFYFNWIA